MTDAFLKDPIALVTGASRGFGFACAAAMGSAGAHVLALARTTGGLEELDDKISSTGGAATLIPLDIRDDPGLERLGAALLTADGAAARVEVVQAPDNVAILRRLQFRDMVTGRLPPGQELHPEAANTITIINPISFVPAQDGSLLSLGQAESLPPDITQAVYPVVLAQEEDIVLAFHFLPQPLTQGLQVRDLRHPTS